MSPNMKGVPTMDLNNLPHGDNPGDIVDIAPQQIENARTLYPVLKSMLTNAKTVVSLCGGSGSGKSGMACLLAAMLEDDGIHAYIMSGDNYPRRVPMYNDAERERVYAEGGREALDAYLGSPAEINFDEVSSILARFRAGEKEIPLKRMGREENSTWYEPIDFSSTQILILEWTHSNSDFLSGVDIPILLNSTPAETLEYRRKRNRDGGVDSPFVTMVLELEQGKLNRQAHKARIIVSKSGELITYEDFCRIMGVSNV